MAPWALMASRSDYASYPLSPKDMVGWQPFNQRLGLVNVARLPRREDEAQWVS